MPTARLRNNLINVASILVFLLPHVLTPSSSTAESVEKNMLKEDIKPSGWICELCPHTKGLHGRFELGSAYISDDSFKFGDYRGLEDKGPYAIGEIDLRYWGKGNSYWEMLGSDLGLDSRSLKIEGGQQGQYEVRLAYDLLQKQGDDSGKSPFLGSGGTNMTLPTGWTRATSTGGMSQLTNALRPMPIAHERENTQFGFSYLLTPQLKYVLDYRRERREGQGLHTGNFIIFTSILAKPIDYTTDEIDASITYTNKQGLLSLEYYGSFFDSQHPSITWENPFTPLTTGGDRGRSALAPDNQAHQITLSGTYQLTIQTQASGMLSFGRMTQDEAFIPSTINANLVGPLPISSLDAKVNTTRLHLRLHSRPRAKLTLNLLYDLNNRKNKTARKVYDFIESDTFFSDTRTNIPYSFQRQNIDLKSNYRFGRRKRFSGGLNYEIYKRNFQEVSKTEEKTVWIKISASGNKGKRPVSLEILHADRDGKRYRGTDEIETFQNPLLRKFNLADRTRDQARLKFSLTPHQRLNVALSSEVNSDDYKDSVLGLTGSDRLNIVIDVSLLLFENGSFYTLFSHEKIKSDQAGSQSFGAPDWFAHNRDMINTLSSGFSFSNINGLWNVGLDFTYSKSIGAIEARTLGRTAETFPELKTRLYSARLSANYQINPRLTMKARYFYEAYKTRDWTLDGLAVNTVSNVLASGAESPNYKVSVIGLWFSYALSKD